LQYYLQALTLLPDDRRIHCYAARAASALGNHELMAHLEHDAIARVNLAVSHRRRANTCGAVDSPTAKLMHTPLHDKISTRCTAKDDLPASVHHYRQASEEYAQAITYHDTHFDALIGYANTFWEWWIHWPPSLHLTGPSDHEAALAERYARRAVGLASIQSDPFAQAIVRSILGKVLLARGRSEAAIEQLEQALKQLQKNAQATEQHPTAGDVRRSLLFAHRCTVDRYQRVGWDRAPQVQISKEQIGELQEEIRQIEHAELRQSDNGRFTLFDYTLEGLMCARRGVPEYLADPGMPLQDTGETIWLHRRDTPPHSITSKLQRDRLAQED
jgi:tetratricopeptide (TPR) repeat protein